MTKAISKARKLTSLIINDSGIEGWFVSLILTSTRLIIFLLAYFVPSIAETEVAIGSGFTTFVLMSVGSWFTYKVAKAFTPAGDAPEPPRIGTK